ncbi:MAG: hypothetical protein R2747_13225 [Pyrinomonadaceae bacterium]
MKENVQFLQAFLKNPLNVGAIAPSSPQLARKMLEGIEPGKDSIILELGVGTGAITKFVGDLIPDEDCYLGLELDEILAESMKKNFPQLNIICGNACEVSRIHDESGLGKVGYIISCLPFVSLPKAITEKILAEVDRFMEQGCLFRTFQYAHGYYFPAAIKLREHMRNRYGVSQKSPLVLKNVPPAYTLTWQTSEK